MGSPVPAIPEVKQQWPCAEESGAEGGMAVEKWCASISPFPTWKSSEQELVHAAVASFFCSGLLLSIPCSVHSLLCYMHMTDLFPCHAFICTTIHYSLPTQGCLGNNSETSSTSQAAQPAQAVQAQPAQLLKTRPGRILLYSFFSKALGCGTQSRNRRHLLRFWPFELTICFNLFWTSPNWGCLGRKVWKTRKPGLRAFLNRRWKVFQTQRLVIATIKSPGCLNAELVKEEMEKYKNQKQRKTVHNSTSMLYIHYLSLFH